MNTTPPEERGWLFLEQFTSALKVAAAGEDMIDKIIISNNPKLRNKMYFMSLMLIRAMKKCDATNSREPMKETMNDFRLRLHSKRFSVPSDSKVVYSLMKKLVELYVPLIPLPSSLSLKTQKHSFF